MICLEKTLIQLNGLPTQRLASSSQVLSSKLLLKVPGDHHTNTTFHFPLGNFGMKESKLNIYAIGLFQQSTQLIPYKPAWISRWRWGEGQSGNFCSHHSLHGATIFKIIHQSVVSSMSSFNRSGIIHTKQRWELLCSELV